MSRCCSSCCCSCCRGNGYLQTTNDAMGGRHQGLRQNDSHLGAQGHVPSMIEWYRVWYMNSQCLQYAVEIYTLVYNIIIYIHWHTWYTWYTCYNCVTVCQKSDYIQWCIIPCFDVTLPDSYYGHSYGRTWRDHTWPRCPHQSSVFRRPGRTLTHQRQLCLDARLHILSKIGCIMVHHGASMAPKTVVHGGQFGFRCRILLGFCCLLRFIHALLRIQCAKSEANDKPWSWQDDLAEVDLGFHNNMCLVFSTS